MRGVLVRLVSVIAILMVLTRATQVGEHDSNERCNTCQKLLSHLLSTDDCSKSEDKKMCESILDKWKSTFHFFDYNVEAQCAACMRGGFCSGEQCGLTDFKQQLDNRLQKSKKMAVGVAVAYAAKATHVHLTDDQREMAEYALTAALEHTAEATAAGDLSLHSAKKTIQKFAFEAVSMMESYSYAEGRRERAAEKRETAKRKEQQKQKERDEKEHNHLKVNLEDLAKASRAHDAKRKDKGAAASHKQGKKGGAKHDNGEVADVLLEKALEELLIGAAERKHIRLTKNLMGRAKLMLKRVASHIQKQITKGDFTLQQESAAKSLAAAAEDVLHHVVEASKSK
eukprot:GILJ01016444.1.p1 GENE.GILJ01016444.1~~GILJ01016444.1.p1  ORF type:complete len:341 (-),score=51.68 GILJ01016444.1:16-1038(-)